MLAPNAILVKLLGTSITAPDTVPEALPNVAAVNNIPNCSALRLVSLNVTATPFKSDRFVPVMDESLNFEY